MNPTLQKLLLSQKGIVRQGLVAAYFPTKQFAQGLEGQRLIDYSGNGYHGTLGSTTGSDTNDPTWTGQGLSFDGDDYVEIANSPALVRMSFVAVVYPTNLTGTITQRGAIGVRRDAFEFSSDKIRMLVANGGSMGFDDILTSVSSVSASTWVCPAGSFDGANLKVYINGALDTTKAKTTLPDSDVVSRFIGRITGGTNYFLGTQAALLIYSRGLSDAEVSRNYAALKSMLAPVGVVLP